jgi:DNA-directed RNA polymerase beta' subunit
MRSVIKEDGSVGSEMKQIYAIDTDGSNLEDILDNPFVDPYRTQTDSIMEMAEMYGIECARAKIISELSTLMDATSAAHLTVYADVMTSTGIITSVERAGTAHRNRTNVTQRASYGAPIQVLREAAIYGYTNKINDVTGALATGTVPQVGTTYHNVTINTKFVEEAYKISETQLDEL